MYHKAFVPDGNCAYFVFIYYRTITVPSELADGTLSY